ncbi:hypothetical protein CDO28_20200 (plasmid) [Sinorhizobium meliloti]|nr:hypothetical protein CDO28_20200 [Sinorhizobium meliloti]
MTPPDLKLPDDVEALKAMVLAMAEKAARADALQNEVADLKARNADADERIERLTQILSKRPVVGRLCDCDDENDDPKHPRDQTDPSCHRSLADQ